MRSVVNFSFCIFFIFLVSQTVLSKDGGEGSGGGDSYTQDFITVAENEIYPWLKDNGHKLNPQVDAEEFLKNIDPTKIESDKHVFESCDGSGTGREVEVCYNGHTDQFFISRTRYPLASSNSPSKRGLIAHEIFRKMKIEGDKYEVTRQIPVISVPGAKYDSNACTATMATMSQLLGSYIDSIKVCYQLKTANNIDGPEYTQQIVFARQIESLYASAAVLCQTTCRNGMSCTNAYPSDACNDRNQDSDDSN